MMAAVGRAHFAKNARIANDREVSLFKTEHARNYPPGNAQPADDDARAMHSHSPYGTARAVSDFGQTQSQPQAQCFQNPERLTWLRATDPWHVCQALVRGSFSSCGCS